MSKLSQPTFSNVSKDHKQVFDTSTNWKIDRHSTRQTDKQKNKQTTVEERENGMLLHAFGTLLGL